MHYSFRIYGFISASPATPSQWLIYRRLASGGAVGPICVDVDAINLPNPFDNREITQTHIPP